MSSVQPWFWWPQMPLRCLPPQSQVGHRLAFPSPWPSSRSKWPWECQASAGSHGCASQVPKPFHTPQCSCSQIPLWGGPYPLLWPPLSSVDLPASPRTRSLLVCACHSFSLEHLSFTLPSSPHPTSTSTSSWLTPTHFSGLRLDVMSSKPSPYCIVVL